MDIDKRSRSDLKSYFVKNSIPRERDFADLIEGMLNQKDDGMVKLPGEPLSIQATGDHLSLKKVINFYDDFATAKPAWTLSLHGRIDPGKPENKPGWNLSDSDGKSRLFIDRNTGYVGVGTVSPKWLLDVGGFVQIGDEHEGSRIISFSKDPDDDGNAGKIAYKPSWKKDGLSIVGAGKLGARKIDLFDDVSAHGSLTIAKNLLIGALIGASREISFSQDAGDETNAGKIIYKPAWEGWPKEDLCIVGAGKVPRKIFLYDNVSVAGSLTIAVGKTLRIEGGTSGAFSFGGNGTFGVDAPNVVNGRFVVLDSGQVGIGTASPGAKLSIMGGLHVGGISDPGDKNLLVDGTSTVTGANPVRFTSGWTGFADQQDKNNTVEISNDTGTYKSLIIAGNHSAGLKTNDGKRFLRKVSVYDNLDVNNELLVLNGSNPILFSSKWSKFPDDKDKKNRAEISNDTDDYKTLMIIGNRSAGLKTAAGNECRRVSVWDRLDVHGELFQMVPVIECKGNDKWGTDTNHPLRQYFRNKLTGQPNGTVLQAMADLPAWGGLIWFGWKGSDGKLRLSHTAYSDPREI
jgi:hypothetical protein